jgi:putative SOS response-associated peptidase YedK
MCSHFDPVFDPFKLKTYFGVEDSLPMDLKLSTWPGYIAPFLRKHEHADVGDEAVPFRELMTGAFGLIPHWSKDTKITRMTYNARTETVDSKPSFREAWSKSWHCIIPAEAFFEPDWRTGKAKPTRIMRTDDKPLGIAGLWSEWKSPEDKQILHSFTMLTINADDHEFMHNYHKPEDEKRMICILHEDEYDGWLSASPDESRYYLRQYPSELLKVDS